MSGHKLFVALRERAARAQNFKCYWCGIEMKKDGLDNASDYLTGDHLVPKHDGGKTVPGNIVAACRKCNSGRHPELNKTRKRRILTIGEEVHHSPFEVLRER